MTFLLWGPHGNISNRKGKDGRVLILQIPTCGAHMDATQIPSGHPKIDQVLMRPKGYQFFDQLIETLCVMPYSQAIPAI